MKIEDKIKNDPELRETFKANIAMAFKDEVERSGVHSPNPDNHSILMTRDLLHEIANAAADNFLDLWLK